MEGPMCDWVPASRSERLAAHANPAVLTYYFPKIC